MPNFRPFRCKMAEIRICSNLKETFFPILRSIENFYRCVDSRLDPLNLESQQLKFLAIQMTNAEILVVIESLNGWVGSNTFLGHRHVTLGFVIICLIMSFART